MERRAMIAGVVGAWLCCAAVACAQDLSPAELLKQRHGLERVPRTNLWITPIEAELRRHWAELPGLRESVAALEGTLAQQAQRNAAAWLRAERAEKTLRTAQALLDPKDDKGRGQLEAQIASLWQGLAPPDRFGDKETVRRQLIDLTDRRHALWLHAQAIRAQTPLVEESYAPLANREVAALLGKLGPNHRLGPMRDYAADARKLPDYERLAETAWVPLYLVGARQRFAGLANQVTPVTFTWTSGDEPALITAAMAEAIDLKPRPGAESRTITLDNRSWSVAPATLPYLRLGGHEAREVEVLILPPEAEHVGARLGPGALAGFRVEAQPERLRLVLIPVSPAAEAD